MMESSNEGTVHLIFKVVCQSNKKQYDTFTHENIPVYQCVKDMRRYLLATFKDELAPAANDEAFPLARREAPAEGPRARVLISTGV